MLGVILAVLRSLGAVFQPRRQLVMANLALRHQLLVLNRTSRKPGFRNADRLHWVVLRAVRSRWGKAFMIGQPQTVIGWHRASFRRYWRWKSRRREGRPPIDPELIQLIRPMWQANPTWGSPRIRDELAKLEIQVPDSTIRWHRPKRLVRPGGQQWTSFLCAHAAQIIAVNFFTVPTATFRILFVFIVFSLERRKVIHFATTETPSAFWTGQQLVNAFPIEAAPWFLLRDRDGIYGAGFRRCPWAWTKS